MSAFRGTNNVLLAFWRGVLRWAPTEAELGHRRDDAELLRQIRAL